jgi:colanic acid/amylovoran biosynthesis glycosyltransferase
VPVIATDISGIPELVRHGQTGLLAPSRHPEALAAAMQQLLADSTLAGRLTREARRRLELDFDLWETTRELHLLMSERDDPARPAASASLEVSGELPEALL